MLWSTASHDINAVYSVENAKVSSIMKLAMWYRVKSHGNYLVLLPWKAGFVLDGSKSPLFRRCGKGNLLFAPIQSWDTMTHQLPPCVTVKMVAAVIMLYSGQLQMLLIPNALRCSLYKCNCVCAVTKFLPAKNFCQLLWVKRAVALSRWSTKGVWN